MKTVHLLDYGVGNIGSLTAQCEALGYGAMLTKDPKTIVECPLLILPGVGSAGKAMAVLRQTNLFASLQDRHAAGRSIIGICLGAQLLFTHLAESQVNGLGFLAGTVARLPDRIRFNTGWRQLQWDRSKMNGFGTGLRASDSFFFNHQYIFPSATAPNCIPVAEEPEIPAMYFGANLCGIQFHPEKSQGPGRILLRNLFRHYHGE